MSRLVITGVSSNSANRLEINDFVKNDKFFSLYVQALQAMSSNGQNNIDSFFQLAGIHGLPYVPWNGATGARPWNPNTTWGGYCVHGSVLFPTWHRPYLMLFEQIMQKQAATIAATYTVDQAAWKQAAIDIRQPFWDWATNSVPPPQVVSLKQVPITGPNGNKITVDNPLYHYAFHPIDPSFGSPYNRWKTTFRQPTGSISNPTDNVTRLQSILRASQSDIRSSTYGMLTRVHTWPAFSSHTVGDGGSTSNSIEAIHDGIHVSVGGAGQMSDPSVAAFDPIFWLHHANVDRMVSLWAAMNPTVWVSRGDSQDGTFTMGPEQAVDATTPLSPFWNAQTTFWASTATRDTAKLGYTYPDFNGLDMANTAAVQTAISLRVNLLYGRSLFGGLPGAPAVSLAATTTTDAEKPAAAAAPLAKGAGVPQGQQPLAAPAAHGGTESEVRAHPPAPAPHNVVPNNDMWDWTARIEFKKYELGTSFSVLLFLGEVPQDPEQWVLSPNFVGAHHAFVNTVAGQCANCRGQGDIVEEGFVHLDEAIVHHSGLHSLAPDVVEPYLTEKLQWRVQKTDGEPAELASLEVSVLVTPLSYPPGAIFPVPGERRHCNGVTHGRPGGSRHSAA